jgi:phosphomannomutase
MNNFIFDVDGTLTPSRRRIDPEFHDYFLKFCEDFNVYLVTGSDYPKTQEQLGDEILQKVLVSFNCSGNSNWERGTEIYRDDFVVGEDLISFLKEKLEKSKFPTKGFTNIEYRPGMINFSIVGRPCSLEMRYLYKGWDEHKQERMQIALEIMDKFPGIVAQVAGETGIDIFQQGRDKSQVAEWIPHPITFFGDNMQVGGNDHPLAVRLEGYPHSRSIQVKDWKDTYNYLRTMTNDV